MKNLYYKSLGIVLVCLATFGSAVAQKVEISLVEFNSSFDDFSSAMSQNGRLMYITSSRNDDKQKIYVVERSSSGWKTPEELSGDVNDAKQAGAVTLTPDGQFMIFSAFKHSVDGKGRTDLYSAQKINGKWGDIQNLALLNSSEFDAQPSLSSDGQTLYFVSDRDGGKGGTDIYISKKSINGWSAPMNATQLNTEADEMSPVIASDNTTLYYASNRAGGEGGFDIYTAKRSGDNFSSSINMRSPINTAADEYFYTSIANSTTAFFSRTNANGDLDVMMAVPNPFPSEPVLLVQGVVSDASTKTPLGSSITITDLKTGKKVADLRSDDATGEYFATLTAGRIYSITASKPGYVFYSERFEVPPSYKGSTITKDIPLFPLANGSTRLLVFFDYDKSNLQDESIPELERVLEFMKENPAIKVSFEGHTDDVGSDDYNDKLSDKRATAVKEYLTKAGIDGSRIKTKGFGKRKPLIKSTTDEARAQNRRVEMKIES
ncbi:MAG: PD40 domain-containing protein [Bacteroidetes bacterium]|nr:PD40 domain-containing protein [Bacteroidota bacterium]